MRRITNLYTLCRLLFFSNVEDETKRPPEFLRRLTFWVMLCEQWPTRIAMVLQVRPTVSV